MKSFDLKILITILAVSLILMSCEKKDNNIDDNKKNNETSKSFEYSVRYEKRYEGENNLTPYVPVEVLTVSTTSKLCRLDYYFYHGPRAVMLVNAANKTARWYNNDNWEDVDYDATSYYNSAIKQVPNTSKYPKREVAGKICTVFLETYNRGTIETAYWNGILMYEAVSDENSKTIKEATSVILKIPAHAFSEETIEVDWF